MIIEDTAGSPDVENEKGDQLHIVADSVISLIKLGMPLFMVHETDSAVNS